MKIKVTLDDKVALIHGKNTLIGELDHFSTAYLTKKKRAVCLWLKNIEGLHKDQLAQIPTPWIVNIEHISPTVQELEA